MRGIFASLILLLAISTFFSMSVKVIHKDMMVANELQTSQSMPDIVVLNNGVFEIWSVPNRGRVLYKVSVGGEEFLYFNPFPLPYYDETEGKYILEFGGVYFSVPWNPRSVQPYNLDYKVERKKGSVELLEFGENPTEKLRSDIGVLVRDRDPKIQIEVTVTNRSGKDKVLNFSVILVFPLDDSKSIESNLKDLQGKSLKNFADKTEGTFNLESGWIGIKSLKSGKSLILKFKKSSKMKFITWGMKYDDYIGGAPYIKFTVSYPRKTLKSGGKITYVIELDVK